MKRLAIIPAPIMTAVCYAFFRGSTSPSFPSWIQLRVKAPSSEIPGSEKARIGE